MMMTKDLTIPQWNQLLQEKLTAYRDAVNALVFDVPREPPAAGQPAERLEALGAFLKNFDLAGLSGPDAERAVKQAGERHAGVAGALGSILKNALGERDRLRLVQLNEQLHAHHLRDLDEATARRAISKRHPEDGGTLTAALEERNRLCARGVIDPAAPTVREQDFTDVRLIHEGTWVAGAHRALAADHPLRAALAEEDCILLVNVRAVVLGPALFPLSGDSRARKVPDFYRVADVVELTRATRQEQLDAERKKREKEERKERARARERADDPAALLRRVDSLEQQLAQLRPAAAGR